MLIILEIQADMMIPERIHVSIIPALAAKYIGTCLQFYAHIQNQVRFISGKIIITCFDNRDPNVESIQHEPEDIRVQVGEIIIVPPDKDLLYPFNIILVISGLL